MKHEVLIWSKNQAGRCTIEDHITITEEEVEQSALRKYLDGRANDEGKSHWAELDSTIHD